MKQRILHSLRQLVLWASVELTPLRTVEVADLEPKIRDVDALEPLDNWLFEAERSAGVCQADLACQMDRATTGLSQLREVLSCISGETPILDEVADFAGRVLMDDEMLFEQVGQGPDITPLSVSGLSDELFDDEIAPTLPPPSVMSDILAQQHIR